MGCGMDGKLGHGMYITIWMDVFNRLWNGLLGYGMDSILQLDSYGLWNGLAVGLWDEEYYMGLVAFRYSDQTVYLPLAAVFLLLKLVSLVLYVMTNLLVLFFFCCIYTWVLSMPWHVCHCSSQFGTMSSKMSSVIVSYQMNMFKQSEKCSSLSV